ncbi:RRI1 [Sanghuangporus sanghuang]
MAQAAASSSSTAFKTFSLENDILQVPPQDEIFRFDPDAYRESVKGQPWKADPNHFKTCKISAVALIKMVIHARSGVPYEIMGLMQGKAVGDTLIVMDSFALPVQGTETRVNAAEAANEYSVEYVGGSEKVGRKENVIGWYHSHPGYACWLSGIDVNTQITNQKYQDPFVAVVIDPNRTISAGKVDIGSFRTYPEGYTPPGTRSGGQYQSIPLEKIEDFGVHAEQYYSLKVEIFTSSRDSELLGALWNKYWVNTLSTSPLISNRAYAASQLNDLAEKLKRAQTSVANTRPSVPKLQGKEDKEKGKQQEGKKKEDSEFLKSTRDSAKLAAEAQHGLISQVLKDIIFSRRPGQGRNDDLDPMQDAVENGEGKGAEPLANAVASAAAVSGVAASSTTAENMTVEAEIAATTTTATGSAPTDEDIAMPSS